jgi:hypothetical protein
MNVAENGGNYITRNFITFTLIVMAEDYDGLSIQFGDGVAQSL